MQMTHEYDPSALDGVASVKPKPVGFCDCGSPWCSDPWHYV